MEEKKKGISLIALIITIIVIIILAAIVIFSGLNTPDRANFAKFTQEISDFHTAIAQDYMQKKAEYAMNKQTRSDAQIYYAIATGADYTGDINEKPIATGEVASLNLQIQPEGLAGTDYYEITDDTHVANWKRDTNYYEPTEKHYLTDAGEPFVLPGYAVEQDGKTRWYINEKKYYEGEGKVTSSEASEMSEEEKRALAIANAATNTEDYMYTDKNGDKVKIPEKYAPTEIEGENTIDGGFVIIDAKGNEWVWIEVPQTGTVYVNTGIGYDEATNFEDIPEGKTKNIYELIRDDLKEYSKNYKTGYETWNDNWYYNEGTTATYSKDPITGANYKRAGSVAQAGTVTNPETVDETNTTGCGINYAEYSRLYKAMLKSVYLNGGFWIGRYEAGISSPRNSNTDITGIEAVAKQNAYSLINITCPDAQILASNMKSGSMNSSLMFGLQWDLTMKYLETKLGENITDENGNNILTEDSTSWGNYRNADYELNKGEYTTYTGSFTGVWKKYNEDTEHYVENKMKIGSTSTANGETHYGKVLLTTGAVERNKKQNIYDLAGNVYEWTLENPAYVFRSCAFLGGGFSGAGSGGRASFRSNIYPGFSNYYLGFRASLY